MDGVFQPSEDEPGGVYAIVKRKGTWIHFQIRRGDLPQRKRQPFERDVYVYVDDLDALYADLKQRGAVITQPPSLAPYGIREIVVEDSNGYRLAFGEIATTGSSRKAFFIGLPGNPVSSFVTFLIFVRPFLLRTQGLASVEPRTVQARADFDWPEPDARREFLRVKWNAQ